MIHTIPHPVIFFFFFFNDTATTEIYTLSLHDALPISSGSARGVWTMSSTAVKRPCRRRRSSMGWSKNSRRGREIGEHTSELQSRLHLVCRLLLEKKKKKKHNEDN